MEIGRIANYKIEQHKSIFHNDFKKFPGYIYRMIPFLSNNLTLQGEKNE